MKRIISNYFLALILVNVFSTINYSQTTWFPFSSSSDKNTTLQLLNFDSKSAVVEITLKGMEIEEKIQNGEKYQKISLADYFNSTTEIGKPKIPYVSFSLGVPEFENVSYTILDSSITKYNNFNIYPAQEPVYEGEIKPFVIDETFYKIDTFYPATTTENSKPATLRDIRVMHFNIYPIKYNPNAKELLVYGKIKLRIEFQNITNKEIVVNYKSVSSEWDKMYNSSIINYSFIKPSLNINPDIIPTQGLKTVVNDEYEYLIIAVDRFANDMQRFADWKNRRGLRTKIKTRTQAGGNNWSNIKSFIVNEYNTCNIKYVLLVGDVDELPLAIYDQNHPYYPSDIYYGDINNTPNSIEVAIGRITQKIEYPYQQPPVEDVNYFIDKEINYEINAPSANFAKKVLLVSHRDADFQYNSEEIRTHGYVNPPTFVKAYGSEGMENETVNTNINNGVGIVNYRGHGGPSGWTHWSFSLQSYSTEETYNLSNSLWDPILFSVACLTSKLDGEDETLAEAFVKTVYGASAYLGASREVYQHVNSSFDKLLFDKIFNFNISNIGNILVNVVNDVQLQSYDDRFAYLWLGEPSLDLWTDTPQQFTNVVVTDNVSSLTVNAGVAGSDICVSSTNSGTDYAVVHNVSSATFNITNRPLYVTVTKHNYAPYNAITGGTITTNENWIGNLKVLGSLVVASGQTITIGNGSPQIQGSLTLQSGTNLTFQNSSSLTVNGTLIANGTSTNKVTFDRIGTTGTWGSIKFDGAGAASSILNYVEVRNAANIQVLNNANMTIQNSLIKDCTQGVYVYNASPQILNNLIDNPSLHGIYINASGGNPLITDNTITKTSTNVNYKHQEGIILYNGTNGYIAHNNISGFDHGVYVGSSNAYLTDYTWQNHYPNNQFSGNRYGIMVGWGSYLLGGYGMNVCWNNSIWNNDYYNIYVYQSSTAWAEYNYWGVGNLKQYVDGTSSLHVLHPLASDPWGQLLLAVKTGLPDVQLITANDKPVPEINDNSKSKLKFTQSQLAGLNSDLSAAKEEEEFMKAIILEQEGKIDDAIEQLKGLVKNKKYSLYALTELAGLKERYMKENVQNYFEDLLKDPNEGNKSRIKKHLAGFYLNKDEDDRAIAIFDELKDDKSSKKDNFEGLLDKFNFMLHKKKDITSAQNLLTEIKNKFANDEEAKMHIETAEMLISETNAIALVKKQNNSEASSVPEVPTEYVLFNNFPNPFNPITTITYYLPDDGFVTLKIYDILGNEVKTLVNEQKEKGRYTVQFDASTLASGMYVYQIKANDFVATKKMMFLK